MTKRWAARDIGLFTGAPQAENFRDMIGAYPVRAVRRSPSASPLVAGAAQDLPKTYAFGGQELPTAAFLEETDTQGLLVLQDGQVVHEAYGPFASPTSPWPCWSVTKTFLGALIGIAIERELIPGVRAVVSDLAPKLAGSGYDGVSLLDVLTMSSGARWSEDYGDPNSETRRHGTVLARGGSLDDFAASLPREWAPGTRLRYNTCDTNVLGLVLREVTRRPLAELLSEWLWRPLQTESEAFFIVDGEGHEWAGAGLVCTLRERARLGLLFANAGVWAGQRLISEQWVRSATVASADHLTCEHSSAAPFGYGYQCWLHGGACMAIGIYNQYVWVDASRRIVIAKMSANPNFGRGSGYSESGYRDQEHMALFEEIAARLLNQNR